MSSFTKNLNANQELPKEIDKQRNIYKIILDNERIYFEGIYMTCSVCSGEIMLGMVEVMCTDK